MTDKRKTGCTTTPDLADVLSPKIDIDDPFYEDVVRVVEEIIPALSPDVDYTTRQLCGDEFWKPLSDGQKRRAGKYLAHAVSIGRLPLRFSVCIHKVPKLYRLK